MDVEKAVTCCYTVLITMLKNQHDARRRHLRESFIRRRRMLKTMMEKLFLQQRQDLLFLWLQMNDARLLESTIEKLQFRRSIWMQERSDDFWKRIISSNYSPSEWLEYFRMSRENFLNICEKLQTELEPKPQFLNARAPVSVQKQVAVALYKLGSCAEYKEIGVMFGIHKSTVKKCLYKVVRAIKKVMYDEYIYMPKDAEEIDSITQKFEEKFFIPQIIGCIDTTHIPISSPENGYTEFANVRGWTSYNILAVADFDGIFRNVEAKHPGSIDDTTVFLNSKLFTESVNMIPKIIQNVDGRDCSLTIVGDSAFPLLPWLLTKYSCEVLSVEEESFNIYLESSKSCIQKAFNRLKARWRILQKPMSCNHEFSLEVIETCCVLHNFVEKNDNLFNQLWSDELHLSEQLLPQPETITTTHEDDPEGFVLRNHLKDYLAENFVLRES